MLSVALIVLGCALVQSVFGIGILFFGTPLLLLLGHTFEQALWQLLPASITVNALQVFVDRRELKEFPREMVLFGLVPLGLGLAFALKGYHGDIRSLVGIFLLVIAALRLSPKASVLLGRLFRRHRRLALATVGFLHGMTNMGGGLLTALVGSLFSEKRVIRVNIAVGYLLLAASQLVLLVLLSPFPETTALLYPMVAATAYLTAGRRIFRAASQPSYQFMLTLMMLGMGIKLLNPLN